MDLVDKKFKLSDLFSSENGNFDIQAKHINGKGIQVVSSGDTNNGIIGKTDINAKIFDGHTITVDMFGNVFYRNKPYKMVTHARVFCLKYKYNILTNETGLYLASQLFYLKNKYNYSNMAGWNKIKTEKITLPTHQNGEIAFDYITEYIKELEAERIKELEAYLLATGLNDYILTEDEKKLINDFKNDKIVRWGTFKIGELFDHIVQGRRLKKDDQLPGELPFVMSGTTNTGIANYISNDVRIFPANSLTVDIFGSVFYRNYEYGMGDDTGAYWNSDNHISKYGLLFIGVAIEKSLLGQYNYGYKLRSSKSLDKEIQLPVKSDAKPDFDMMSDYIRAVEKLVIKGVIEWKDKQIAMMTKIVNEHTS